jgi:hypothetical protein
MARAKKIQTLGKQVMGVGFLLMLAALLVAGLIMVL